MVNYTHAGFDLVNIMSLIFSHCDSPFAAYAELIAVYYLVFSHFEWGFNAFYIIEKHFSDEIAY